MAMIDAVSQPRAQDGPLPSSAADLIQDLQARVTALATTVEQNEDAVATEFTTFHDHHDSVLDEQNRLSVALSSLTDSVTVLATEVRSLRPAPPPPAPGSAQRPFVIDAPSENLQAPSSLPRNGSRFRPLPTPSIIRPSVAQQSAALPGPIDAPQPLLPPRPLRRRQPDSGPRAAPLRYKRPRVDATPYVAPALRVVATVPTPGPVSQPSAPIAGPSTVRSAPDAAPPARSDSTRCRVRFGSIGWAPDPATLRQQVYTAALPVWDVDFALFACLDSVALDESDNTYMLLSFLSRDDAQGFVDTWYANRVKSVDYARAQAHIV